MILKCIRGCLREDIANMVSSFSLEDPNLGYQNEWGTGTEMEALDQAWRDKSRYTALFHSIAYECFSH